VRSPTCLKTLPHLLAAASPPPAGDPTATSNDLSGILRARSTDQGEHSDETIGREERVHGT
jgi:hypothetical protein